MGNLFISAYVIALFLVASLPGLAIAQGPKPTDIIPNAKVLATRIETELRVTKPDYVVFAPQVKNGAVSDTGNEHFLVFDGPDGSLMAVWTQSSAESQPDQHIAFSRSTDEGVTWSRATVIAGPKRAGDGHMASWAYPLVSRAGRIYVLFSQHIGRFDSLDQSSSWTTMASALANQVPGAAPIWHSTAVSPYAKAGPCFGIPIESFSSLAGSSAQNS